MKNTQPVSVRFTEELFKTVKELALKEHRSFNQQVILFVEQSLNRQEQEAVRE